MTSSHRYIQIPDVDLERGGTVVHPHEGGMIAKVLNFLSMIIHMFKTWVQSICNQGQEVVAWIWNVLFLQPWLAVVAAIVQIWNLFIAVIMFPVHMTVALFELISWGIANIFDRAIATVIVVCVAYVAVVVYAVTTVGLGFVKLFFIPFIVVFNVVYNFVVWLRGHAHQN